MTCRVVVDLSLRGGVYREAHRTPTSFSLVSGGVLDTHHDQGEPGGASLGVGAGVVKHPTHGEPSRVGSYRTDVVLRRREIMRTAEIRRDLNVRDDTRRHARLINLSRSDGSSVLGSTLRQSKRPAGAVLAHSASSPTGSRNVQDPPPPPHPGTHSTARVSASSSSGHGIDFISDLPGAWSHSGSNLSI
jgi:hypothetical protein